MGEFLRTIEWGALISGAAIGALGLGARIIIQAPVRALTEQARIIRSFWWLSPQKPFGGVWEVIWKVESARFPPENVDRVHVRRLFANVTFSTSATLADGSSERCVFVGKLVDKAVTGRWFNPEDEGRGYFGAFQFRLHGSLRRGDGSWVGWRNDGTIQSQELSLRRFS